MTPVELTGSRDALLGALGRFVVVPKDVAFYDTDIDTGARALRATPEQIAELARAGLPYVDDPERGLLFDYDDLMNVGMLSGTGLTVPELGQRFLMRFAASPPPSWFEPREWVVTVRPPLQEIRAQSRGRAPKVSLRVPDTTAPGVEEVPVPRPVEGGSGLPAPTSSDAQPEGYEVVIRLTGARQEVRDPRVRTLWNDIVQALTSRAVYYQTVPEALRDDYHRAWELGAVDCIVASKLLAVRLREMGLPARVRRGYLLGLFGSDHAWCELYEDGVYKVLDPVFAFVATVGDRSRGVAESPAFAAACFGSRFNRLMPCVSDDAQPLLYFDERPAPYWAMVGVSARPWRS